MDVFYTKKDSERTELISGGSTGHRFLVLFCFT